MHVNRALVFWGVALITAGGVALAIQAGAVPVEPAQQLWRYWPVVLIVIGVAVMAARTPLAVFTAILAGLVVGGLAGTLVTGWPENIGIGCGGEPDEQVSGRGSFAGEAEVRLDFNCGRLAVMTVRGSDWAVEARHSGSEPDLTATASGLSVSSEGTGIFGLADARQEWSVELPADVRLDLEIDANAVESGLDLDGAHLARLAIDANAGDVGIALPGASVEAFSVDANAGSVRIEADAETTLQGTVGVNAGSLALCVPDDVGLAITLEDDNVTFSHNLDEGGLERQGSTWRQGGTDPSIVLEVEGNAASFTLNPDGGCS